MSNSITVTSHLPPETLRLESMTFSDGLSRIGEMQLTLTSENAGIAAEALLGKPISVQVTQRDGSKRHFNGHVTRFAIGAHQGRHFGYQATVRPWLWFLTRTSNCRIFQDMAVPEIVKTIFADHGVANFEFTLFRRYRPWVYCVQYRESDFNFIARLLEHEGIYWYFDHSSGQHKLKLVDAKTAHDAAPVCASLPFITHDGHVPPDIDHVSQWLSASGVKPGKMVLTSYDFERPGTALQVHSVKTRVHDQADAEVFDFQGDYTHAGEGNHLTEVRIDEAHAAYEQASGRTCARGIASGRLVTLQRHPHQSQNQQYLVTGIDVTARAEGSDLDSTATEGTYQCTFSAIPVSQQYRAPRSTPKPSVQGPQTAVVVGPEGEEIHTDKYGRVKVQFHWDRLGKKNEKSSCWVRVSHPWAGKSFGGIHIPRIGQEVVVDFLEGDPDQPLITGRVYNAANMPPWELPANATQSGFLTRSTKDGHYGTANALRFEDKMGAEQLWLHAEKDQLTEVENDEDKWVGNDRRKTIDRDETSRIKRDRAETVDRDETITVHGKRTEIVDGNETITIHSNRRERVDQNEQISIGQDRTEDVGQNETISIGGNRTEEIAKNETISIGGSRSEDVVKSETISVGQSRSTSIGVHEKNKIGKNWSINVGKTKTETIGVANLENIGVARMTNIGVAYSLNVGAIMNTVVGSTQSTQVGGEKSTTVGKSYRLGIGQNHSLKVGSDQTTEVGKDLALKVGGSSHIEIGKVSVMKAADTMVFECGKAKLVLKSDGGIYLQGTHFEFQASQSINADGKLVQINCGASQAAPDTSAHAGADDSEVSGAEAQEELATQPTQGSGLVAEPPASVDGGSNIFGTLRSLVSTASNLGIGGKYMAIAGQAMDGGAALLGGQATSPASTATRSGGSVNTDASRNSMKAFEVLD